MPNPDDFERFHNQRKDDSALTPEQRDEINSEATKKLEEMYRKVTEPIVRTYSWDHPLPFGESYWVKKSDVEPAVIAVRQLLNNIYEFGAPTDDIYLNQVEDALKQLTSGDVTKGREIANEVDEKDAGSPTQVAADGCPECGAKFYHALSCSHFAKNRRVTRRR